MPRISEDARGVVLPPETALPTDYPPPPALGVRAAAEWRAVLQRMGLELLPRETHALLEAFCAVKVQLQTITEALAEFGGQVPEDKERWRRYQDLTRMRGALANQLASLSTKLRIAPSARTDRHWTGATARRRGAWPAPWGDIHDDTGSTQ